MNPSLSTLERTAEVAGDAPSIEVSQALPTEAAQLPPHAAMIGLISSFFVSRGIYVAARLGLADAFNGEPKTIQELAETTGTHAPALYRLVRALTSIGLFSQDVPGRFSLTPVGATLRSDAPGSLRAFAMSELGLDHYQAWEHFVYSIRTGKIAFDHRFGMNVWEYYSRHAENGRIFDESMTNTTLALCQDILARYDFSPFRMVVDVGGGKGHLLAGVLRQNPAARGILYDLPAVAPGARDLLAAEGLAGRTEVVTGDFFQEVPRGGDAYLLKWILHDWNDEQGLAILRNIRRAIAPGGRLLVMEAALKEDDAPAISKWIDLLMLVITGGRERTEAEFRTLLEAAGFQIERIVPTQSELCIIEAAPA